MGGGVPLFLWRLFWDRAKGARWYGGRSCAWVSCASGRFWLWAGRSLARRIPLPLGCCRATPTTDTIIVILVALLCLPVERPATSRHM